ncbi:MAG: hypothetical protein ACI8QC_003837 [Planctomycetota bacterium]|jgi:hypothetical protein
MRSRSGSPVAVGHAFDVTRVLFYCFYRHREMSVIDRLPGLFGHLSVYGNF